ncbi:hypothetical protein B0O99DRAFT_690936 [Bisporella sp. PMI_857]|nr:hypothetical protein B0O99DRAFT_690936 [Bisporella sp. PMI_857]
MPLNWKDPSATTRLLAAIIAAHPNLKLNYEDVGRYYGGGARYKQIWDGMNRVKRFAADLSIAVERGEDPINVELISDGRKCVSRCMGGDSTPSAIENRMRRVKTDAKSINNALERGADPSNIEIARYFGEGLNKKAVSNCLFRHVTPVVKHLQAEADGAFEDNGLGVHLLLLLLYHLFVFTKYLIQALQEILLALGIKFAIMHHVMPKVKLLQDAAAEGKGPNDLDLFTDEEIVNYMGSDCTEEAVKSKLKKSFRPLARLQRLAFETKHDPAFVDVQVDIKSYDDISTFMGGDCTKSAIKQRLQKNFKPLAKLQRHAHETDHDPQFVDIEVDYKTFEYIAFYMGRDASTVAVKLRIVQNFKPLAQLQRHACETDHDPQFVDLQVNYKTYGYIAFYLGDDATKKAVELRITERLKPLARLQRHARETKNNPQFVDVTVTYKNYECQNYKMARLMGGEATPSILKNRIIDKLSAIGKLQQVAADAGRDPAEIDLDVDRKNFKKIAKYMGTDATGSALSFQFKDKFRPIAKVQRYAINNGLDPKYTGINIQAKDLRAQDLGEIARHMGTDVTKGGLEWQFRSWKKGAKIQQEALSKGIDPKDVNVEVNVKGEPREDHQHTSLAGAYGDVNGNGPAGTPTKKASTPRKSRTTKKKGAAAADGDDDDDEEPGSAKKGALNKVATGRVTKGRAPKAAIKKYAEESEEEDDDDGNGEIIDASHITSNGNGYHSGDFADDDGNDLYFETEEA